MSVSVLIEAVEVEGFGGGGVVAPAFGDVQVAGVFDGRDDGGADGGQVGGPAAGEAGGGVFAERRVPDVVVRLDGPVLADQAGQVRRGGISAGGAGDGVDGLAGGLAGGGVLPSAGDRDGLAGAGEVQVADVGGLQGTCSSLGGRRTRRNISGLLLDVRAGWEKALQIMESSLPGQEAAQSAALVFCEAIHAHADLCSQDSYDSQAVAAASARIDQAAANYAHAVREMSGWGVSFERYQEGVYPKYDQLLEEYSAAGGGIASPETVWPVIIDRFKIDAASAARLMEFAQARDAGEVAGPEEAIRLMYEKDRWDPTSYPEGLLSVDDYAVNILPDADGHDLVPE